MLIPRPRPPRLIAPIREPATTPPALTGTGRPATRRLDDVELLPAAGRPRSRGRRGRSRAACRRRRGRADLALAGRREAGDAPELRGRHRWPAAGHRGRPARRQPHRLRRLPGPAAADRDGAVTELTRTAGGTPHPALQQRRRRPRRHVYFTDSSNRFPVSHWRRDLLEHRPNGRVLAYDPGPGRTEVVADGFYFPNGVALTPDEDALLLVRDSDPPPAAAVTAGRRA